MIRRILRFLIYLFLVVVLGGCTLVAGTYFWNQYQKVSANQQPEPTQAVVDLAGKGATWHQVWNSYCGTYPYTGEDAVGYTWDKVWYLCKDTNPDAEPGATPPTPQSGAGSQPGQQAPPQNTLEQPKTTWVQGSWQIQEYDLDNDPVVKGWLQRLRDPGPAIWRTFPNIPNPDVPEFDVAAGAEYGVANVPYCQQDKRCDLVVPGWHYRLVTGNYTFLGRTCGAEGVGCLLLVINVMDQTYTWRDVTIDNGFTVPGRYWDGDKLEWAVWGLVSHASANMLNMPTMASETEVLNSGNPANAGGNCGIVTGCNTVDAFVVVHAGDRVLATAQTTVTHP